MERSDRSRRDFDRHIEPEGDLEYSFRPKRQAGDLRRRHEKGSGELVTKLLLRGRPSGKEPRRPIIRAIVEEAMPDLVSDEKPGPPPKGLGSQV
jgi:hypothetical protein